MKISSHFLFAAALFAALSAGVPASAQQTQAVPVRRTIQAGTTTRAGATPVPAGRAAEQTPANNEPIAVKFVEAAPAGTPDGEKPRLIERLLIVDSPAPQVFDLLERLTGKSVIRSQTLPVLRINFDSRGPIATDKAIVALESLLALNGVSVIPEGEDFLKAVVSGYATSEAPPLYVDSVADLPASERSVARLFRFRNINVANVEPLMRGMVTHHRGGSLLSMPAANSILVTDSLTNVQRLERLVGSLDVPGQVLFYNLKNVKASEIVKQLQALQQGGMKNLLQGEVGFSANDTTNQLLIVTSTANKDFIDSLVERLDVETVPLTRSAIFPLKHADADDVADALKGVIEGSRPNVSGQNKTASVTIIGNGSSSTGTSSSSSSSRASSSASSGGSTSARRYSADGADGSAAASSGGTYDVVSAPRGSGDGVPATTAENASDTQRFSDYLTIIGDTRANSVIVIGTNSDIRQIADVVEKIDIPLPQVRIEAIIVEVLLSDSDVSGLNTLGFGYKLSPTGTTNTLAGNYRLAAGAPNGAFSMEGSLRDLAFEMVFNQAKTDSRVKVLSSPTIMTMHNKSAQIVISEQRPVITGSTTDSTSMNTSSQVTYKDIGLELEVTPRIGSNGTVQIDVSQKIDNIIGTTSIDGNEQPLISSRRATSYISIKDRETIALAGLQSFDETTNKGKVYILGDIPLIGALFRPKTYSSTRRELIVFLRPFVITDAGEEKNLGVRDEALTRDDARAFIETGRFPQLENPDFTAEKRAKAEADAAAGTPEDSETPKETEDAQ